MAPKNCWAELTPWERRKSLEYTADLLRMDRRRRERSQKIQDREQSPYKDPLVCWAAEAGIHLVRIQRRVNGQLEPLTEFCVGGDWRSFLVATYYHNSRRLQLWDQQTAARDELAAAGHVLRSLRGSAT